MVYITVKDKQEARKIGRYLIDNKLAACVNIIDNINSIYFWEGKIQDDDEAILITKTKKSQVAKLINEVKKLHSYSCPCVVSLPILDGNPDYLKWLGEETK